MRKNKTWWARIAALGMCVLLAAGQVRTAAAQDAQGAEQVVSDAAQGDPDAAQTASDASYAADDARAADLVSLQEQNPDIYAWLEIPGLVVDYPVLQSPGEDDPDQEYYLHHTKDREESVYGSIFTQNYNQKDFADFLTVIYGHNMKDATMFGSLSLYEDPDFFQNHRKIYVYLPEATLEYEVLAAYPVESVHLLYNFDITNVKACRRYLKKMERQSAQGRFDEALFENLTEESHILALSTCYHGDPNYRFLVQAVLSEEEGSWTERAIELGLREPKPDPRLEIKKYKFPMVKRRNLCYTIKKL